MADGPVPASWSLGGDDMGAFTIGASTGQLEFRSPPDFEAPTDMGMDNIYMVTVIAKAGGEEDMRNVTVTVIDVDELGTLMGQPNVDYEENGTSAVATYMADSPGTVTWSRTGDDMEAFTIGSSSGELMFASPPDFEGPTDMGMDNMYMVTVIAKAGGEMGMMDVTVTVTNLKEDGVVTLSNESPLVGDVVTASLTDDPDGSVTGMTWQWSRTMDMADGWTAIMSADMVSYTAMAADEGYYLQATATYTDGYGPDSAMEMTANPVTAVMDQKGTVTLSPTRPKVGDEVTATLTDLDGSVTGMTWQWSRSMDMTTWMNIADANSATYTPVETDAGYYLRATVSYTDGHGGDKTATGMTVSSATFADQAGTVSLSPTRPKVGDEVVATLSDPDGMISAEMWQWSRSMDLTDTTSWMEIMGANSATYTPVETDDGYYLQATVNYTDREGAGKTATAMTVSPVTTVADQAGTVSLSPTRPQAGDEVVATLSDPDGMISAEMWQWSRSMDLTDTTSWMDIQGADSATYTPVETDDGYYLQATVSYTDGHGAGKTATAMTVAPVTTVADQAGTVSLSPTRPQVGNEVMATLSDPDGSVTGMTWQWSRSMDMATWTDIADANSAAYTPVETDDGYYLRATASYTDGHGAGKSAMMDTAGAVLGSLADRYDANGNRHDRQGGGHSSHKRLPLWWGRSAHHQGRRDRAHKPLPLPRRLIRGTHRVVQEWKVPFASASGIFRFSNESRQQGLRDTAHKPLTSSPNPRAVHSTGWTWKGKAPLTSAANDAAAAEAHIPKDDGGRRR